MDRNVIILVLATFHTLGIISAFEALYKTKNSQSALAWCLFLIMFPYFGLPLYWTFGRRKFLGYREEIGRVIKYQQNEVAWFYENQKEHELLPRESDLGLAHTFENIAGEKFLTSNKVTLLIDGIETFKSMFKAFESAKKYIFVEFFIIKDDEIGRQFRDHLVGAAKRGVKVYLIYDEFGCKDITTPYLESLKEGGVNVTRFGTRKGFHNFFQINFRNHRKIVVIDGNTSFVGGHNVGDEYLGRSKKFGHWRDCHLKIEGPATIQIEKAYVSDNIWATGSIPDVELEKPKKMGETEVLVLPTGPADTIDRSPLFFQNCIASAKKRVWIASPYFVPDEGMTYALQLAALRGVDVRIIIPEKRDHWFVWLASFFFVSEVTKHGVKVFRYQDGFLHEKVVLVDDDYCAVGTANFDNRSFRLNFEIMNIIASKEMCQQVETMLLDDISKSRDVSIHEFESLSFGMKVASKFARLMAPTL